MTLEDLGQQLMATVESLTEEGAHPPTCSPARPPLRAEALQLAPTPRPRPCADFTALVESCRLVLKSAAHEYWPVEALEQFLQKQSAPPELVETFLVVWRGEREKVHEIMRRKSSFTDGLDNFGWRVDVKSSARHVQQINEPSAILEFAVSGGGGAKTVRCEADRQMVASVLESLEAIQAKIDQLQA